MIQFNGNEYSEETVEKAMQVFSNTAQIRTPGDVANVLGQQYGGDREIYDVLGYPDEVTADQYRAKYRRQDIAKRIVELPAEDTWRDEPNVFDGDDTEEAETPFEQDLETLVLNHRLYHYCKRADVTTGIGEYGLLFLGVSDSQPLSEEVNMGSLSGPEDLAFMTPFSQASVEEWTLGRDADLDPSEPRYNKPVEYEINFADIGDSEDGETQTVHWTRVIHIAEGLVESDLKGTPRLRPVYNRLQDLEKVTGASAEMFWTGADRKFQFNIDTDDTTKIDPSALSDLDEQVSLLVHDMEQYIKTFNTDMKVISGEEVDPSGIMDELFKSISGATGIPKRILTGSERGELASQQDRANWFGRIESRQYNFAEPVILRPLLDRFVEFGILSPPAEETYEVEWPTLFELTDLEQAEIQRTRAEAINRAAPSGNTDLLATPEQIIGYVLDGDSIEIEESDEFDTPDDFDIPEETEEAVFEENFGVSK